MSIQKAALDRIAQRSEDRIRDFGKRYTPRQKGCGRTHACVQVAIKTQPLLVGPAFLDLLIQKRRLSSQIQVLKSQFQL